MDDSYHTTPDPSTPPQKLLRTNYGLLSPDTPTFPPDAYMSSDDSEAETIIQDDMDVELYSPRGNTVHNHGRLPLYSGIASSNPDLESSSQIHDSDSDVVISSIEPEEDPRSNNNPDFWADRESSDKASSPQRLRRSTRVTRKSVKIGTPPSAKHNIVKGARVAKTAARKAITLIAKRDISEEAPTINAQNAVTTLVPFDQMPTVQSIDWQLMYPPGGSTHASYPYPSMDPLLFFHPQWVTVTDGIPDISKIPKLALPLSWKHITWTGLLPVVFDPYQQAFKLTPIGPLPLNHEELQQNGLHDYVPGGKHHPESAMLPQMMDFSDGSNDEVYNWDNIDLTLPWIGIEKFYPSDTYGDNTHTLETNITHQSAIVPWRESRDCPDKIYDLEDAWRWLVQKEQNPTKDFEPSKAKSWVGIRRTYRKFKSPIPIQMMVTRSEMMENEDSGATVSILVHQDRTTNKNAFCPFRSVSTPACVDITLLHDTEFTLMELLSYFPNHFHWFHAIQRLEQSGVTRAMIRDVINMTRGLSSEAALKIHMIRSAEIAAKKQHVAGVEEAGGESAKHATITSYTAENWAYDATDTYDYPLFALGHGLLELPEDDDAGPLTKLISWCRNEEKYDVLLSDVPKLLEEARILPFIEPSDTGYPDQEFVSQHQKAAKKDRARVKASSEDN